MSVSSKPAVLITGISGNLGVRLARQLPEFAILGLDIAPPDSDLAVDFERIDLAREESCHRMVEIMRQSHATAVVHLAFVIDEVRAGVRDRERMWQINVAGTARVMEAIAHVNRTGGAVRKFIFPGSASAYGPETPGPVKENHRLNAHTLPYAMHKQECDEVVQARAHALGACSTYLLRPHIFVGATMDNYLVGVLRGTPGGRGRLAERLRRRGTRLPLVLPFSERYRRKLIQFVHVDDVARLMGWILRRAEDGPQTTILNVTGRGEALSIGECARLAGASIVRLPGMWACGAALRALWKLGISAVPPESLPYMTGSFLADTSRLRSLLGAEYESIIRYTIRDALADSLQPTSRERDKVRATAHA